MSTNADVLTLRAEEVAASFHEAYERLAPNHGYETRQESQTNWDDVPDDNKSLMVAVAAELLAKGKIRPGPDL